MVDYLKIGLSIWSEFTKQMLFYDNLNDYSFVRSCSVPVCLYCSSLVRLLSPTLNIISRNAPLSSGQIGYVSPNCFDEFIAWFGVWRHFLLSSNWSLNPASSLFGSKTYVWGVLLNHPLHQVFGDRHPSLLSTQIQAKEFCYRSHIVTTSLPVAGELQTVKLLSFYRFVF